MKDGFEILGFTISSLIFLGSLSVRFLNDLIVIVVFSAQFQQKEAFLTS